MDKYFVQIFFLKIKIDLAKLNGSIQFQIQIFGLFIQELAYPMEQFDTKIIQNGPVQILSINKTQSYAWGSNSKQSFVGKMTKQNLSRYAQFWMGTHPNGQSKISQNLSLKTYLSDTDQQQLQFLFKILSIHSCLSIQAHPNEQQAKQLNKKFPLIYVDDKDKPQMFLTLSDQFQLFLGFIQENQLQELQGIQPLKTLYEQVKTASHRQKILFLVQKIVSLSDNELKQNLSILFENIQKFDIQRQDILKRLSNQFPNDSGILVSCLLQYHVLQKSSCFGIQAGVPHAYIKGQCFQLMKNSDNVVRLGLTPKNKDIPNLLKILKNNIDKTYCQVSFSLDNKTKNYNWNPYKIQQLNLEQNSHQIQIQANSIGILISGQACILYSQKAIAEQKITRETVFFIPKGTYFVRGQGNIYFASKS